MNLSNLSNLIFTKQYVFSEILIKHYKDININDTEFIIIIFLLNKENNILDYNEIMDILKISITDVASLIHGLKDKKIIDVHTIELDGKVVEIFSLDFLKGKLASICVGNSNISKDGDLLLLFEESFGRSLSAIEVQKINDLGMKYEFSKIKDAISISVLNGVRHINYIEKVLENKNDTKVEEKKKNISEGYNWLNE